MEKLTSVIANEIIKTIETIGDYDYDYKYIDLHELAYEMYNNEFYIIGTHQAKEFMKENLDMVLESIEDYHEQFGEPYLDITNVESVVTLTVLYVAQKILNQVEDELHMYNEEWNEENVKLIKEFIANKYC